MKITLEIDEKDRIYVNGIRFSKKMTLEDLIEEIRLDEAMPNGRYLGKNSPGGMPVEIDDDEFDEF